MGLITNPNDTVLKCICMPRLERDWINNHKSINFSGLAQEMVLELMKKYDPLYYSQNKKFLESKAVYRKDFIDKVIETNPDLIV